MNTKPTTLGYQADQKQCAGVRQADIMTPHAPSCRFLYTTTMALAALLIAMPWTAAAACYGDEEFECKLSNGCPGTRMCIGGKLTPCACTGGGGTKTCTSCGNAGTQLCDSTCKPGVCVAGPAQPETCDQCDNDYDGSVDEGITCPIQCSTSSFTSLPYNYNSESALVHDLQRDPEDDRGYATNINHNRRIHMSQYVKDVRLQLASFESPDEDDELTVTSVALSQKTFTLNSTSAPGYYNLNVAGLGDRGVDVRFVSDSSLTGAGFEIPKIEVMCGSPLSNSYAAPLSKGNLHQGLLVGTGDALYFSFYRSATEESFLVMDGPVGSTFMMFVRQGQLPNTELGHSAYDFQATGSATRNEWGVRIPPTSGGATQYFVLVKSVGGAGVFNLTYATAKPEHRYNLNVGFDAPLAVLSNSERLALQSSLRSGARRLYAATEGAASVSQINVFLGDTNCTCGGDCDICIKPDLGVSNCFWDDTTLHPSSISDAGVRSYSPSTISHELLHCETGLWPDIFGGYDGDEYREHKHEFAEAVCVDKRQTDPFCGHSVMGGSGGNVNNLCTSIDHKSNGRHMCCSDCQELCGACPPTLPNGAKSQWQRMLAQGKVSWTPNGTPDNRSLADHVGIDTFFRYLEFP